MFPRVSLGTRGVFFDLLYDLYLNAIQLRRLKHSLAYIDQGYFVLFLLYFSNTAFIIISADEFSLVALEFSFFLNDFFKA